jgi:hypothetical protein
VAVPRSGARLERVLAQEQWARRVEVLGEEKMQDAKEYGLGWRWNGLEVVDIGVNGAWAGLVVVATGLIRGHRTWLGATGDRG